MIAVRVAVCLGLGFILLNHRIAEKTIMQSALCAVRDAMLMLWQEILISVRRHNLNDRKVGELYE